MKQRKFGPKEGKENEHLVLTPNSLSISVAGFVLPDIKIEESNIFLTKKTLLRAVWLIEIQCISFQRLKTWACGFY